VTEQPSLLDWRDERDTAMARVESNAGPDFTERACAFVLDYLSSHGPTSGELLTLECKAAGIRPHDDRAMGPVFMRLSRRGLIVKRGTAIRRRGHGTSGGNVWGLA
jgi:hypothetical protein